jgi:N-methylhydantoinase B
MRRSVIAPDAIELEIMWSRLLSIANQGAVTLLRTSFSTIVGSSQDFKYVLADAAGNLLAPSDAGDTLFVITFPRCLKSILKVFSPDELCDGDVIITNDPWICAGHFNDIHIATPIFKDGRLVAWTGSVVHLSDIGGRYAPFDALENYEEGICIPIRKLYGAGVPNEDLLGILLANVRVPDMQLGDIRAMVAANRYGARLLLDFMAEYGLNDLATVSASMRARVEQAMRNAIRDAPDGSYEHDTWIDGFGVDVRIHSRISIESDSVTVDYSGSSEQTSKAAINCVLNATLALTLPALKAIFVPHIPSNEGAIVPINVVAPEGSILNALRPAPLYARSMVMLMLPDHIMGSLSRILPDRVTAEMGTRWFLMGDRAPLGGKRTMASFFQAGSLGAAHHRDGASAKFFPIMAAHTPIELFEHSLELRVVSKSLRVDSGGPGQFRGGNSQVIVLENPGDTPVVFNIWQPRIRHAAKGVRGGADGASGVAEKNGQPIEGGRFTIEQGDTVVLATPAGGGFGDPLAREAARVEVDVREGYVSIQAAEKQYGVVLDPESGSVDTLKTRALRTRSVRSGVPDRSKDPRPLDVRLARPS